MGSCAYHVVKEQQLVVAPLQFFDALAPIQSCGEDGTGERQRTRGRRRVFGGSQRRTIAHVTPKLGQMIGDLPAHVFVVVDDVDREASERHNHTCRGKEEKKERRSV